MEHTYRFISFFYVICLLSKTQSVYKYACLEYALPHPSFQSARLNQNAHAPAKLALGNGSFRISDQVLALRGGCTRRVVSVTTT